MKKILSLVLALAMLFGLCAFNAQAEEAPVTLTYWTDLNSTGASVMSNLDENLSWQLVQEATGVDVEFLHPAVGQVTEQFNLLVASGDLPDIIEYGWNGYAGGIQKAIDDNLIIALNDYMPEYAPNYSAMFEQYPDLAKQVKTDDGTICVFAAFSISDYNCQSGWMVRQDWLDEAGIATPVTLADWENAALTLMDEKDLECGIALYGGNVYSDQVVGIWGIGSAYYVDNGAVKYGPIEEGYLDFLTKMKEWYDNGILDPDFAAMDAKTMESYMINGDAMGTFGFAGGNMGNIYTAVEAKGEEINLVGTSYPVLNEGDKNSFINMSWEYRGSGSGAITTACENIPAACKLLDYFFSDEGRIVKSFGQEGVTFNYVDGVPTYSDLILHNSDGLSMAQSMALYLRCNSPWVGFIETGYHEQYFARPVQLGSAKTWNETIAATREHKLPMVTLTSEESTEMSTMTTIVNDYRDEMVVKFIMGQEPLENYDQFVAELKNLGIERILEIYQTAYERYLAR